MNKISKIHPEGNAVCFAADDSYFKYLYVTIYSLVKNADSQKIYDIVVLSNGISDYGRNHILKLASDNISIRFIDMGEIFSEDFAKQFFISGHVSLATYFRFFIPTLFEDYSKVAYLDCDMIIDSDIADIFEVDMQDNLLGVVNDVFFKVFDNHFKDLTSYIRNELRMDPDLYFNAGVILYNIPSVISFDLQNKCFELLKQIKNPRFHDQDILNSVTAGRNIFLPVEWNIQWHMAFEYKNRESEIRQIPYYDAYYAAMPKARIVHYTTNRKPWAYPSLELAEIWWSYARSTPFYEAFLESAFLGEKLDQRLAAIAPGKLGIKARLLFWKALAALFPGSLGKKCKRKAEAEKDRLRYVRNIQKIVR